MPLDVPEEREDDAEDDEGGRSEASEQPDTQRRARALPRRVEQPELGAVCRPQRGLSEAADGARPSTDTGQTVPVFCDFATFAIGWGGGGGDHARFGLSVINPSDKKADLSR